MITEDKWFYFIDGKKASSLEELQNLLKSMENAEFVFHVNAGKNDFANWTEGVFQEKELADEMRRVFEKKRMIELLDEFFERKNHPSQEREDLPVFGVKDVPGWDDVDTEKRADDETEEIEESEDEPHAALDKKEESINAPERPVTIPEWKAIEVPKIDPSSDVDDSKDFADDDSLKRIVFDSRRVIKEEEARFAHKAHPALPEPKFLVKEFIYGFIIGLIFGLMMLGILLNLRP